MISLECLKLSPTALTVLKKKEKQIPQFLNETLHTGTIEQAQVLCEKSPF